MHRKIIISLAACLMLLAGRTISLAARTVSSTVAVNGSGDLNDAAPGDGVCDTLPGMIGDQCSLRAAIEELNAQGPGANPHHIVFSLAGGGPFTITPASALPDITVPLEIDGSTQAGSACPGMHDPAVLLIVLDGSLAGSGVSGLTLETGSDGSILRGLVIGNFDSYGILVASNDNKMRCNHIGVGADGITDMGNGAHGILLAGDNNIVGGQAGYAQRNVISGNDSLGIRIESADNNLVGGNYIGTTADGLSALSNGGGGIYMLGNGNRIGGDSSYERNYLSGNVGYGIRVNSASDNLLIGNYIGIARDGSSPLSNQGNGIEVLGDSVANSIGGTQIQQANRIANNALNGLVVSLNGSGTPLQNVIRGNAIYANNLLGIDLGIDGVDANDPLDADGGENEGQNYPVLLDAEVGVTITGTLLSQANTTYTLDFYRNTSCDPSGYGEGQQYLGEMAVTTDGSGHADFVASLSSAVLPGDYLTATATDPDGNTSEFSACVIAVGPPPTPTPTPTATTSPSSTPTRTATATPSPSPTPTGTSTPGPSPTPTGTSTPGPSPTPTSTSTPGPSPTPTGTSTPGPSPTATEPSPILELRLYLPLVQRE